MSNNHKAPNGKLWGSFRLLAIHSRHACIHWTQASKHTQIGKQHSYTRQYMYLCIYILYICIYGQSRLSNSLLFVSVNIYVIHRDKHVDRLLTSFKHFHFRFHSRARDLKVITEQKANSQINTSSSIDPSLLRVIEKRIIISIYIGIVARRKHFMVAAKRCHCGYGTV